MTQGANQVPRMISMRMTLNPKRPTHFTQSWRAPIFSILSRKAWTCCVTMLLRPWSFWYQKWRHSRSRHHRAMRFWIRRNWNCVWTVCWLDCVVFPLQSIARLNFSSSFGRIYVLLWLLFWAILEIWRLSPIHMKVWIYYLGISLAAILANATLATIIKFNPSFNGFDEFVPNKTEQFETFRWISLFMLLIAAVSFSNGYYLGALFFTIQRIFKFKEFELYWGAVFFSTRRGVLEKSFFNQFYWSEFWSTWNTWVGFMMILF